jgi:hypothetical protein
LRRRSRSADKQKGLPPAGLFDLMLSRDIAPIVPDVDPGIEIGCELRRTFVDTGTGVFRPFRNRPP